MKRMRVLRRVMHDTGANKIWSGFLLLFFASAFIIWLLEPEIPTYGKALWYLYTVVTTIGFGDIVAQHLISRILSVFMSINAAVSFALITGVIVNFYTQVTQMRHKDTLAALFDKLERLPSLPPEELEAISKRVRDFKDK